MRQGISLDFAQRGQWTSSFPTATIQIPYGAQELWDWVKATQSDLLRKVSTPRRLSRRRRNARGGKDRGDGGAIVEHIVEVVLSRSSVLAAWRSTSVAASCSGMDGACAGPHIEAPASTSNSSGALRPTMTEERYRMIFTGRPSRSDSPVVHRHSRHPPRVRGRTRLVVHHQAGSKRSATQLLIPERVDPLDHRQSLPVPRRSGTGGGISSCSRSVRSPWRADHRSVRRHQPSRSLVTRPRPALRSVSRSRRAAMATPLPRWT